MAPKRRTTSREARALDLDCGRGRLPTTRDRARPRLGRGRTAPRPREVPRAADLGRRAAALGPPAASAGRPQAASGAGDQPSTS